MPPGILLIFSILLIGILGFGAIKYFYDCEVGTESRGQ
jgi:hypothetical protein